MLDQQIEGGYSNDEVADSNVIDETNRVRSIINHERE